MLLQEFKNAFLFKNRHLLFVECKNPSIVSPPTKSELITHPEEGLVAKEVPQA